MIAVVGVIWVERIGIDDPIGAVAVHGMSGIWGTLACGLFAVPLLAKNLATGTGGLVYTGGFHQLGVQALGLVVVGAFTFSASFGGLWVMNKIWGIRVHAEAETQGLDVSEHGMWGYPEFYIPVPGGYGTGGLHGQHVRHPPDRVDGHRDVSHGPPGGIPAGVTRSLPQPGRGLRAAPPGPAAETGERS